MSRTAIVVLVILLVGGVTWLLLRPKPSAVEQPIHGENLVLTGHRSDGSRAWVIEAQAGEITGDEGQLEEVQFTYFQSAGHSIQLQAEQLLRTSAGSTLSGSVTVKQEEDVTLHTESMFWDERNGVLEAGPVTLDASQVSLSGGSFRHELEEGRTVLSRGVEAELVKDGVTYTGTARSAEATSNQITLLDEVAIQSSEGDTYQCGRLSAMLSGETLELAQAVSGTWQSSAFSAEAVSVDATGIRLRGNVVIELELLTKESAHDS
jgi:hypothetical protein